MKSKKRGRWVRLSPEQMKKYLGGPLRHDSLGPFLETWMRKLYARVGRLLQPTFEQWEVVFLRDTNPDREMFLWEIIARTHEAYSEAHPDDDPRKTLGMLCAISMNGRIDDGDDRKAAELQALFRSSAFSLSKGMQAVKPQTDEAYAKFFGLELPSKRVSQGNLAGRAC